jgi:hypothetical protein
MLPIVLARYDDYVGSPISYLPFDAGYGRRGAAIALLEHEHMPETTARQRQVGTKGEYGDHSNPGSRRPAKSPLRLDNDPPRCGEAAMLLSGAWHGSSNCVILGRSVSGTG